AANPLRGLAADTDAISDQIRAIDGPVVLVGHSYGGAVISNVAADAAEILGLVYVAGFAPAPGESCLTLASRTPSHAPAPLPRAHGTTDLYIKPDVFHEQFAAAVPAAETAGMAVAQRPITREALTDPSGDRPLWRELPSWFVFGEQDRVIPCAVHHQMARR